MGGWVDVSVNAFKMVRKVYMLGGKRAHQAAEQQQVITILKNKWSARRLGRTKLV